MAHPSPRERATLTALNNSWGMIFHFHSDGVSTVSDRLVDECWTSETTSPRLEALGIRVSSMKDMSLG